MEKLGSSLYTIISKCGSYPFTREEVLKMGISLISNMKQLHQAGYIHGDIKPDNILLCLGEKLRGECISSRCKRVNKHIFCNYTQEDLKVKIIDFGNVKPI
jgi:serine/threonine protein kinase